MRMTLTPRTRRRLGTPWRRPPMLATGIIVGIVWGAWHAPLLERDSLSGALPLAILLAMLFCWLVGYRVLMVWIYDRSRSLPVVMFMHALLVTTQLTLSHNTLTGPRLLISLLAQAATMWLLAAAVVVATRRRVSPQALQTKLA